MLSKRNKKWLCIRPFFSQEKYNDKLNAMGMKTWESMRAKTSMIM